MPSDAHAEPIAAALAPAREAWHSALTQALEEVSGAIDRQTASGAEGGRRAAVELGDFASGRIDAERFAALLADDTVIEAAQLGLLERVRAVLAGIAAAGSGVFDVALPAGGDLAQTVGHALAECGRAFGAARVAALVRGGRAALAAAQDPGAPFPVAQWTRAERTLAPPMLVRLSGGDLQAGGLAEYLDGAQKIALLVSAPAPPAALAALITPGVFVMQTNGAADFERFAAFDGPGVAALVPEGCATFVHDPRATPALMITHLPGPPKRAIGTHGAFQQREELLHLEQLAASSTPATLAGVDAFTGAPASGDGAIAAATAHVVTMAARAEAGAGAATVVHAGEPVADPRADRLAAWLLAQSGFTRAG